MGLSNQVIVGVKNGLLNMIFFYLLCDWNWVFKVNENVNIVLVFGDKKLKRIVIMESKFIVENVILNILIDFVYVFNFMNVC